MDEFGIRTDILETMLAERKHSGLAMPRFLYTIPSFHNPTGITMSYDRRRRLIVLAAEYDFLIVEDDAYGELSFSEKPVPLKAMDSDERVLHVGSISKIVAPGMRIGWIAGPETLITAISWFKKDLDHPFAHAAIAAYLQNIDFEERIELLRDTYRSKRDTMVQALEQYMPEWVTWHVPNGGFFVWLHISQVDTAKLLKQALSRGVSYIPGKYFYVNQQNGLEFLRLSFSYVESEQMIEGVQKLGKLLSVGFDSHIK